MTIEFRPLTAEEVEVRVNQCSDKGCSLLLYKDARCDMRILDETVGPESWDCSYEQVGGNLFCTVGIKCDSGWVYKQDVGVPSNMEATKGEASDSFKRACFKWGIGRELYTAPRIWVGSDHCNIREGRNGKPQCYDDFRVTEMDVEDGRIVGLQICNMSKKGIVVYGNVSKQQPSEPLEAAKRALWEACKRYAKRHKRKAETVLEGVKKRPEWEEMNESPEWLSDVARELDEADG